MLTRTPKECKLGRVMNQKLSLEELFEALGKKRWVIAKTTANARDFGIRLAPH